MTVTMLMAMMVKVTMLKQMVNDGKDFDILDGKSGNGVDGKMLTMVTSVMLVEVMLSVGDGKMLMMLC